MTVFDRQQRVPELTPALKAQFEAHRVALWGKLPSVVERFVQVLIEYSEQPPKDHPITMGEIWQSCLRTQIIYDDEQHQQVFADAIAQLMAMVEASKK